MILAAVLKHIDLYPFTHFLVFYRVCHYLLGGFFGVVFFFFNFLIQWLNLLIALGFSKVWWIPYNCLLHIHSFWYGKTYQFLKAFKHFEMISIGHICWNFYCVIILCKIWNYCLSILLNFQEVNKTMHQTRKGLVWNIFSYNNFFF